MKTDEAIRRIKEHMVVHHMKESPHCHHLTEALNVAINVLGAIDQIVWERNIAISQLKELGIGFGEKIDGVYLTKEKYDDLLSWAMLDSD